MSNNFILVIGVIFTGTIGTNLASFECYYSYSVIARWYHPFKIPRVFICYLYGRFRLFQSLFAVYYASGQRHVVFSSSNRSSPKLTMAAPVLPLDPNPDTSSSTPQAAPPAIPPTPAPPVLAAANGRNAEGAAALQAEVCSLQFASVPF